MGTTVTEIVEFILESSIDARRDSYWDMAIRGLCDDDSPRQIIGSLVYLSRLNKHQYTAEELAAALPEARLLYAFYRLSNGYASNAIKID